MIPEQEIPYGNCICSICGINKDNNHYSFYKTRHTKNGNRLRINTNCKECTKYLRKQTHLLKKIYKNKKPNPGSTCPCCKKPKEKFEFDHDHKTGEFRGWICKDCNVGMGKIGDNIDNTINVLLYQAKSLKLNFEKFFNKYIPYVKQELH
jgi:hypothetical protein